MKRRSMLVPLPLILGLTLMLILLATVAAQAPVAETTAPSGEWHVCLAGPPDCDFAIIRDAVAAAADGDVIKVAGGVYDDVYDQPWDIGTYYPYTTTQVVVISKTLTIRGGYTAGEWSASSTGASPTILDAQGLGRGIYIVAHRAVTLENLTVVNGRGGNDGGTASSGGGGITARAYQTGTLTIRNCDIMSSTASGNGGGLGFEYGNLVLDNSRIISNTASGTGGGIYVRDANLTMTGNLVAENVATSMGGGVEVYESTASLVGNTIRDNRSNWGGGGLRFTWGNVTVTGNSLLDNVANGNGGGISVGGIGDGNRYTITNNLIQSNLACLECDGGGGGAQISAGGDWVEFSYNRVISNVASQVESKATRGTGGGLAMYGPARVAHNLFQGNYGCTGEGCGGMGGGASLKGDIWFEGNRVLNNYVSKKPCTSTWCAGDVRGGGVAIHNQSRVTMTNNILAGNHYAGHGLLSKDNAGGAIYLGGQTDPTDCAVIAYHNTIADNQSPAILNESGGLTMSHTILAGHETDIKTIKDTSGLGPVPVTALDYTLWWPSKNLNPLDGSVIHTSNEWIGNPDFSFGGGDNYHLGLYSEAIDRGPGAGVGIDIDDNIRPQLALFDLGADEALRLFLPFLLRSYSVPTP